MHRKDSHSPDGGLLAANSSETPFSQVCTNSIAQSSNGGDRGTAHRLSSVVCSHHADLSSPRVAAISCPSPSFCVAYATTTSAATASATATATALSPNITCAASSTPPSAVAGTPNWSSSSVGNSASSDRGRNTGMAALDISTPHPRVAAAASAAAEITSPPPYLKQGGRPQASNFMAYTPPLHHNNRMLGGSGGRGSTGTPPYFNGYPLTGGPSAPYPLPVPLQSTYGNCNGGGGGNCDRQFAGSAATSSAPTATVSAFLTQQYRQRQQQQQQPEQRGQAQSQSQGQGQDHNNQNGNCLDVLQDPAVVVLSSVQPPPTAPHEPWSPGALYFRAPWLPTTLPPVIRLHLGSASPPSSSATSSPGSQCYEATRFTPCSEAGSVASLRAQLPTIAGDASAPPRRTAPSSSPKAQASKPGSMAGAETESSTGTGTGTEATPAPLASQSSVKARVLKPNNRRKRQIKNRVKPEDLLTETRFCSCCGKYKMQDQFDPERLTCERCRGRA